MSGMALIVDRKGTIVELASRDVLVLRQPDGATSRVGVRALDCVVIETNALISSDALRALAACGVGVVAPGSGRDTARVFAQPTESGVRLRHQQHLAYADPERRLTLARLIVRAKAEAQIRTLEELRAPLPSVLLGAPERIDQVGTIGSLLGVEGTAARAYLSAWGALWRSPWEFTHRTRRPPLDPVNALMSLGYAMAQSVCARTAVADGLDLTLGFLHEVLSSRPAFALDLLESCRPAVDLWVWQLAASDVVTPASFDIDKEGACLLKADARRAVYANWFMEGVPLVQQRAMALMTEIKLHLREQSVEGEDTPRVRAKPVLVVSNDAPDATEHREETS